MTNANSFHSAVFVLLIAGGGYFVAMGIFALKDWIAKKKRSHKKEE